MKPKNIHIFGRLPFGKSTPEKAGQSKPPFRRRTTVGAALALAVSLGACAPAHQDVRQTGPRGFDAMGHGIAQLVLSPFIIAAGVLEGIVMLPYYMSTDVHALNDAMVSQNTAVDLDRTYRYAYGQTLGEAATPAAGRGTVFRTMDQATAHFQRVLSGYGVTNADEYILTAVRSADRSGYTLYAVVHRPGPRLRIAQHGRATTLGHTDKAFYRPYRTDAYGATADTVIDWAGVPRKTVSTQKGQAILMTLAANSVLINRRSDDYWNAENAWYQGRYKAVVADRQAYLDERLGKS